MDITGYSLSDSIRPVNTKNGTISVSCYTGKTASGKWHRSFTLRSDDVEFQIDAGFARRLQQIMDRLSDTSDAQAREDHPND